MKFSERLSQLSDILSGDFTVQQLADSIAQLDAISAELQERGE